VVGHVAGGAPHRGGEVLGACSAARVRGAPGGIATDLLLGCLRVPQEVAGRVRADHDGSVDPGGVAPGVDHGGARAGALAQQVDLVVAERDPSGLKVVDLLREAVAGEIDSLAGRPGGAGSERVAVGAEGVGAEAVGGVQERRGDFRAVEPHGPVHTAIADKNDVAIGGETAGLRELYVGQAGTTFQVEDWFRRCTGRRPQADHR
jgi:hypothetical protein